MKPLLNSIALAACLAGSATAHAVTLVQTDDPGYYNNAIGTSLNSSNGGEGGPFPISNDSAISFPTAPDLSAASAALGNWLTSPGSLNANWNYLAAVPNAWTPGTEVAVMYRFDTLGATNVVASFGVDNGIYVWLDGNYLFGARGPGSYVVGEYVVPVGNLAAGTHYLQLILEDHGSVNGYDVSITADTFIPGVPEQSVLTLFAIGGVALALSRVRRSARVKH